MTTTWRNGTKWDTDNQILKGGDPFCEPDLVSILFLSCGRPQIAAQSLFSTFQALSKYQGEIEWLLLEQSDDEKESDRIIGFFKKIMRGRNVVIRPDRNYGINNGINQLFALSRGEFCMIHENDWLNVMPQVNFMNKAVHIMHDSSDVGIVQLRDPFDPWENWGYNKPEYNPWSCDNPEDAGYGIEKRTTPFAELYGVCSYPNGYNNNPILMRKSLWREAGPLPETPFGSDPRYGESEMQEAVARINSKTAHVGLNLYHHIGGARVKEFQE